MEELKIALVGSAPSSVRNAPYGDPSWQIWGCSPGTYGVMTRVTSFFELHLWEPGQTWFSPEYVQWLQALPGRDVKLWMGKEEPDLPGGLPPVEGAFILPHKEILDEFDPNRWFCTSSLFWMMAMAIKAKPAKIGLWGVDMASTEEYEMQRAGIHFLAYEAKKRGIEVGCPAESDLFTHRFRYGIDEWTHGFRKTRARMQELKQRQAAAQADAANKNNEAHFLAGAIDDLKYMTETWIDKGTYTGP